MVAVSLLLTFFLVGAAIYLFRQPTEDAMGRAALKVFAVLGILIAILIVAAVVVRKRTNASWSQEDALKMTGERRERQQQPESRL